LGDYTVILKRGPTGFVGTDQQNKRHLASQNMQGLPGIARFRKKVKE